MRLPTGLTKATRFSITGLFVTGLHVFVATYLITVPTWHPSIANGLAFVLATLVSYVMNTVWSFSAPLERRTLHRFVGVSVLGCMLAMAISGMSSHLGFDYRIGIGFVVVTIPPISFVLHSLWTYRT